MSEYRIKKILWALFGIAAAAHLIYYQPFFLEFRAKRKAAKIAAQENGLLFSQMPESHYQIKLLGIPLAQATFWLRPAEQEGLWESVLEIKPFEPIGWISGGRAGIRLTSVLNKQTTLPVSFEQRSFSRIKKDKPGRSIAYHHEALTMERRGYTEDIMPDTRDPLSLLAWLSLEDFSQRKFIKSSMNIERDPWLVIGKPALMDGPSAKSLIKIKALFMHTNKAFQIKGRYGVHFYTYPRGQIHVPVLIHWQAFHIIPIELELTRLK